MTKHKVRELLADDFKVPGVIKALTDLMSETYQVLRAHPTYIPVSIYLKCSPSFNTAQVLPSHFFLLFPGPKNTSRHTSLAGNRWPYLFLCFKDNGWPWIASGPLQWCEWTFSDDSLFFLGKVNFPFSMLSAFRHWQLVRNPRGSPPSWTAFSSSGRMWETSLSSRANMPTHLSTNRVWRWKYAKESPWSRLVTNWELICLPSESNSRLVFQYFICSLLLFLFGWSVILFFFQQDGQGKTEWEFHQENPAKVSHESCASDSEVASHVNQEKGAWNYRVGLSPLQWCVRWPSCVR